jgi:limonene-1,2-epoxide hydrolase
MTTTLSLLDVVQQFLKPMGRGDYDRAMVLISKDCDDINPPPLGAARGAVAVRGVLDPFVPSLVNELKVLRKSSTEPVVFTELFDRHRLSDGWVDLPVTGCSRRAMVRSATGATISTRRPS